MGDLSLYGTFTFIEPQRSKWSVRVRFGTTVPTGNILPDPHSSDPSQHADQHLFFGTGTFDPRTQIRLVRELEGWSAEVHLHGRISLYKNRHGYQGVTKGGLGLAAHSGFGLTAWRFGLGLDAFGATTGRWHNSNNPDLLSGQSGYFWKTNVNSQPGAAMFGLGVDIPMITSTADGSYRVPLVGKLSLSSSFV